MTPTTCLVPARGALLLGLATAALLTGAASARADEIVTLHPDTCEQVVIKAHEVLPETWTEVEYRERDKGPTKKVPLALVLEIHRSAASKDKSNLENALLELDRGNLTEARMALRELAGGGYSTQEGQRVFTSFMPKDTGKAKGKRPAWTAEYAHFFYAKALVLEGLKTQNDKLLEEALLCLDDLPVPGADPKQEATTGGFLARFKGGNSRWLPEAIALKGRALIGLKRFEDAAKVFEDLYNQAVTSGLSPRWVYEAKVGPGLIAEAQGDQAKAIQAYEQAPTALDTLIAQVPNRCLRLEVGRYYSQLRAHAAALMLAKAEAAGTAAAYGPVKAYLLEGQPEALKRRLGSRPPEQQEALLTGARAPEVQAVNQIGLGQAYLAEGKFEEAVLALRAVAIRHFGARERAAAALYFLAKAADGAGKAAKGAAQGFYLKLKDDALNQLKTDYRESPYASK